ncbi:MAG TPA: class I SAM-dependent methyltransferase [Thermoguttaceae bacterium]|nr:class I SAM-dependent methyltransferase [Thermoguttaceae bacterium]
MKVTQEIETVSKVTVDHGCPSCGHVSLLPFYEVDNVPAHSCLLMPGRAEAVEYPRGTFRLAFCERCGMITNTSFDSRLHEYSPRYEETQHFSGRFCQFAKELAGRLIDGYGLRDKDILEIGCGKGEFLATLCEMGENRGIGIDPAAVPQRIAADVSSRLRFIHDFYSPEYRHLPADLICCRHTLEHIQPVHEFVDMIRQSIDDRPETLVFFEVPDVTRVLRERAFWDLYYEHCSYFSLGSLVRLFGSCRFEVLEARYDFDDQYLWLMARPSRRQTPPSPETQRELQQLSHDVQQFSDTCSAQIQQWRQRILAMAAEGRRPVAWGGGSKCVSFLTTLDVGDAIEYVVDINPYKQGEYLPGTGQQVVAPEFLREYRPGAVVVMNPIYCEEIRRCLEGLGIEAELIPV